MAPKQRGANIHTYSRIFIPFYIPLSVPEPFTLAGKMPPRQEGRRTMLGRNQTEKQTLRALDQSHAIITFAPDGIILDANPNFLGMMGYSLTAPPANPPMWRKMPD